MKKASQGSGEAIPAAKPPHGATHRGATTFFDSGVRAGAYRSARFARAVAEVSERDHRDVRRSIEALLKAGILPIRVPVVAAEAAAAMEGARILAAISSQQVTPGAVVRVTGRILTMAHRCVAADQKKAGASSGGNGLSFEAGLSDALQETWDAAAGTIVIPSNVMVTWSENGGAIFGRLHNTRAGLIAIYASEAVGTGLDPAAMLEHVRGASVGGSGFSALSIIGFAETLRAAVSADEEEAAGS